MLIRCRDLGEPDLCRCFTDFLTQHLNKTELLPEEAEVMRAVILDRIAKGEALLLVDGLDEITNPRVRMMFCQELERTTARYPDAPVVVTSRIVGYRDMPYRMGSGFEHGQIAELNREDKDLFARRWVEVTEQHQTTDEKAKRAQELLEALHSNDRIERLTGNPMLLTTLALVKRKVGKLPNKRNKLYAEAVSVLLNWNPRLYQTIEEDEAIPQLEYLAYEMCRRGVQRLADDEVLDLLDRLRVEYPNIRAIKRREGHAFLKHLEERSSILIKSGGIWQRSTKQEKPVWEFRHLTFQEYLAARALLDGRYPGRDRTKSLAEQVAPLASAVQKAKRRSAGAGPEDDVEVPESWREVLRLLVADCRDDDIDDVIEAIANPLPSEDSSTTQRPRAVLAALCIADEPNVSPDVITHVFQRFATNVGIHDYGTEHTSVDDAATEVCRSLWGADMKKILVDEFVRRPSESRRYPGSLYGVIEGGSVSADVLEANRILSKWCDQLGSNQLTNRIAAALAIAGAAYMRKAVMTPGLIGALLSVLSEGGASGHAAAWALGWLSAQKPATQGAKNYWRAADAEVLAMTEVLTVTPKHEHQTVRWLALAFRECGNKATVPSLVSHIDVAEPKARRSVIEALGQLGDKQAVAPLLAKLDDPNTDVRQAIIGALGQLGDKQAVAPLLAKLDDPDKDVRRAVIAALGQLGDKQAVAPLLAKLNDKIPPNRASAAAALHALGEPKGTAVLQLCLTSDDVELRRITVRAYARQRDVLDQRLLSRDLDAAGPWLDPQEPVTDAQVTNASSRLNLNPDQVRSRYEVLTVDLNLKLSWKS